MNGPGLRARSVSEIVDTAFQLYRQNPLPFIIVTALAYTPYLILQLMFIGAVSDVAVVGSATAIAALGAWIGFSLMSTVIISLASKTYLGKQPDLAATVREVLPRLPAVMAAALLKYLFLLAGIFLFLIGALWVAARYFGVTAAIVIEGIGPVSAFRRSGALSEGRKWNILRTLGLVVFIYYVLVVAITMTSALAGSQVVITVSSAVVTIVAYPLIGITEMVLYYDTRIRREGFDIEVMVEGLAGPAVDAHPPGAP